MAYNVGSLITQVQRWAKDSTLDPTLIIEFLDDTQQEVLGEQVFSFMETTEIATLTANDTQRAYPADHQSTERIWLIDPDNNTLVYRVHYKKPLDFFKMFPDISNSTPDVPRWWTDYGRSIRWSTPLKKNYELRHQYIKVPGTLAETSDVPDIPEEFKSILLFGALARVEEHRENFDIAAIRDLKKETRAEDMAIRYSPRQFENLGTQNSPWSTVYGTE